ncbi:MAG: HAD-IB family hydrolase [Flavobacteriales bacterium]|nr:HAD-IB family hydrolase [Flavobacteriales bacterium]MBP9079419.1 HAD-IB family hydrolase [Flavobacteriales bacterium]
MRNVALFDLDGTLTRADTLLEFLDFALGKGRACLSLASTTPLWAAARLGCTADDAPKKALVRRVFGGQPVAWWAEQAERFRLQRMPRLLRSGALQAVADLQRQGTEAFIVTASCTLWVEPWCRQHGLGCIATELESDGIRYTGRLATPNCKGGEKVRRIHAHFGTDAVAYLHAYGDTPSDRPMLALAKEAHYKPFRQAPA